MMIVYACGSPSGWISLLRQYEDIFHMETYEENKQALFQGNDLRVMGK